MSKYTQIDLTVYRERQKRAIKRAKERNIIIPTFAEMKNPDLIDDGIKAKLKDVGLWDINPLNLFRITWNNEPKEHGGGFGGVNYIELPEEITGVKSENRGDQR